MRIVGLTGGISCGKSLASEIFSGPSCNYIPIIDCDIM